MTVTATTAFTPAVGNGSTTAFPFTFSTAASLADIAVFVNGVQQEGGFTVILNSGGDGGTVTFSVAPANGAAIIIASEPSFEQPIEFANSGAYNPSAIDGANDQSARRDIFLLSTVSRAALVPLGETIGGIPDVATRTNKLAAYDNSGNPTVADPTSITGSKGDPGGSAMSIGLFTQASGLSIPIGTDRVRTSGYDTAGIGGGDYIADAAVNSSFVSANPRTSFISANGRGFRLDPYQYLTFEMFGGHPDAVVAANLRDTTGGTYNDAAMAAVQGFANRTTNGPNFIIGPRVNFKGDYRFQNGIDLKKIVELIGTTTGVANQVWQTRFFFPNNVHCITINQFNTSALGDGAVTTCSTGSLIRGITVVHATGGTGVWRGFWVRSQAYIAQCVSIGAPGKAFSFIANSGGGTDEDGLPALGNVNGSFVERCIASTCGSDAFTFGGSDANACVTIGLQAATSIGGCAIKEVSSLGNTHIAPEADSFNNNGLGRTSHLGNDYMLIDNTAGIGASTEPGTNDLVWYKLQAGSTYSAWSSGGTYKVSMPYFASGGSNRSRFVAPYQEGGLSHIQGPAGVAGGQSGFTRYSNAEAGLVGGGTINPCGYGVSLSTAIGNMPPGSAFGTDMQLLWGPDLANGILEILNFQGNGDFQAKKILNGTTRQIDFTIDGATVSFGYTLKGATATFGRSSAVEGMFYANGIALGSLDSTTKRIQAYAAGPPAAAGAEREVRWNDGSNGAYAAVDYWICKAGVWTARP